MKRNITGLIILSALLLSVVLAPSAANGVIQGVDLCLKTLIPSLYVFAVISNMAADYLPKNKLCILILGTVGGYVSTASMLRESGLKPKTIERYLPFCITPSPVFVLALFGYKSTPSIIVITSLLVSNLFIMLLTKGETFKEFAAKPIGLISSIKSASAAMLSLCSAVILFCAFAEILQTLGLPLSVKGVNLSPLLDISRLMLIRTPLSPAYAAVFLSIGGISAWLQISVILKGTSIRRYLATRIPAALLSGGLAYLLSCLFYHPSDAISALAIGGKPVTLTVGGGNIYGGIVLIITCILFLLSSKKYDITTSKI